MSIETPRPDLTKSLSSRFLDPLEKKTLPPQSLNIPNTLRSSLDNVQTQAIDWQWSIKQLSTLPPHLRLRQAFIIESNIDKELTENEEKSTSEECLKTQKAIQEALVQAAHAVSKQFEDPDTQEDLLPMIKSTVLIAVHALKIRKRAYTRLSEPVPEWIKDAKARLSTVASQSTKKEACAAAVTGRAFQAKITQILEQIKNQKPFQDSCDSRQLVHLGTTAVHKLCSRLAGEEELLMKQLGGLLDPKLYTPLVRATPLDLQDLELHILSPETERTGLRLETLIDSNQKRMKSPIRSTLAEQLTFMQAFDLPSRNALIVDLGTARSDAKTRKKYEKHKDKEFIDPTTQESLPFSEFARRVRAGHIPDDMKIEGREIYFHVRDQTSMGKLLLFDPTAPRPLLGTIYLNLGASTAADAERHRTHIRSLAQAPWELDGKPSSLDEVVDAISKDPNAKVGLTNKPLNTLSTTLNQYIAIHQLQQAWTRCSTQKWEIQNPKKKKKQWNTASSFTELLLAYKCNYPCRLAGKKKNGDWGKYSKDFQLITDFKLSYIPRTTRWVNKDSKPIEPELGRVHISKPLIPQMVDIRTIKKSSTREQYIFSTLCDEELLKAARNLNFQPMDHHETNIGLHPVANAATFLFEDYEFTVIEEASNESKPPPLPLSLEMLKYQWQRGVLNADSQVETLIDGEKVTKAIKEFPELLRVLDAPWQLDFFDNDICFGESNLFFSHEKECKKSIKIKHTAPIRTELLNTELATRPFSDQVLAALRDDLGKTQGILNYLNRYDHPLMMRMPKVQKHAFQDALKPYLEKYSMGATLMKPPEHLSEIKGQCAEELANDSTSPVWEIINNLEGAPTPSTKEDRRQIALPLFPRATLKQQQAFRERMERQEAYLNMLDELNVVDPGSTDLDTYIGKLIAADYAPLFLTERDTFKKKLTAIKETTDSERKKEAFIDLLNEIKTATAPTLKALARVQYPILNLLIEVDHLLFGQLGAVKLPDHLYPVEDLLKDAHEKGHSSHPAVIELKKALHLQQTQSDSSQCSVS